VEPTRHRLRPKRADGSSLAVQPQRRKRYLAEQQFPIVRVDDAGQRSAAVLTIEFVALKATAVEVWRPASAKDESRFARWTFDFSMPRFAVRNPSTIVVGNLFRAPGHNLNLKTRAVTTLRLISELG